MVYAVSLRWRNLLIQRNEKELDWRRGKEEIIGLPCPKVSKAEQIRKSIPPVVALSFPQEG